MPPLQVGDILNVLRHRRCSCLCSLNANLSIAPEYSDFRFFSPAQHGALHSATLGNVRNSVLMLSVLTILRRERVRLPSGVNRSCVTFRQRGLANAWTLNTPWVNEARLGFWCRAGHEIFNLMRLFAACVDNSQSERCRVHHALAVYMM